MAFEYKILPVQNDLLSSPDKRRAFGQPPKKTARKAGKDKRESDKHKVDGVIVSLSGTHKRSTDTDPEQTGHSGVPIE